MKHLLHYSISYNSKIVQNQLYQAGERDLMVNHEVVFNFVLFP